MRRSDGGSLYDHYKSVERLYGKPLPKELDDPEYPKEASYLLQIFGEVSKGRQSGMAGPALLSWSDLNSYVELTQQSLEPWEVILLKELDEEYIRAVDQHSKEDK